MTYWSTLIYKLVAVSTQSKQIEISTSLLNQEIEDWLGL